MPTQVNYRDELKTRFGINKNISQALTDQECEALWQKLESEPDILKLVTSYVQKNSQLSSNNRKLGYQRSQAERNADQLQRDYLHLSKKYSNLEQAIQSEQVQGTSGTSEQHEIDEEIAQLQANKIALEQELHQLQGKNKELRKANDVLQKDNKDLKNTVDKIRLEVTRKIKELLQQEDSELRKSMVRMFKGILG